MTGRSREFRLPKGSAFAPLNRKILSQSSGTVRYPEAGGTALLDGQDGALPEMATDVIDPSVSYAVENVKRDVATSHPWLRVGLGFLLGRVVGGERAARL
ncbi:MAG: hypothetical protein ABSC38_03210 [Verrucomicrobiia bacterium]